MSTEDNTGTVEFTRAERTVLEDAIEWYIDENDISNRQENALSTCLETLDESDQIDITTVEKSLITDDIIRGFAQAIEPYVKEMENPQESYEFFAIQFKEIDSKVSEAHPPLEFS